MGILLSVVSKFRKKASTKEILQEIEDNIEECQSTLHRNQKLQNTAVLILLTTSFFIYFGAALVFYLWFLPKTWSDRFLYIVPFLAFPILVYVLRKVLHFLFVRRISRASKELEELKSKKKKLLENVMETETYKVAKELLERYDPGRNYHEVDGPSNKSLVTPSQDLRRRHVPAQTPHVQSAVRPTNPDTTPFIQGAARHGPRPMQPRFQTPNGFSPQPRLLNAPILARDRSFFDKVAEYFVGDGPNNRYALICCNCYSHNGMALMEEFEYISFKCCYCQHFNPARKQRLNAPKLEDESINQSLINRTVSDESVRDNSEDKSGTETDESSDNLPGNSVMDEKENEDVVDSPRDNHENSSIAFVKEEGIEQTNNDNFASVVEENNVSS